MTITPAALAAFTNGDLDNFIAASTPGGIEAQEKRGQEALVSTFRQLPKDMGRDGRKVAEALGFVFGEDVDDIFVSVTAPVGWTMQATDHSMHSDIVDDQGRRRGSIFYKAAFYDRRASGRWGTRFEWGGHYPESGERMSRVFDRATQATLLSEGPLPSYAESGAADERMKAWLDERFPNHADALAYWDDPS